MLYNQKIPVGISACTYGCKVRYNGKGWDLANLMGRDKGMFQFHVFCPEVAAGLGVPRNPIKLTGGNGEDFWSGDASIHQQGKGTKNHEMKEAIEHVMAIIQRENIHVYIYMEGSPTCGILRTTNRDRRTGKPPGILGHRLLQEDLFLICAQDLQSPIKWWDIRRRLLAYLWVMEQPLTTKNELFQLWHAIKFLCQEIQEKEARQLGKNLAALPKGFNVDQAEDFRKAILSILKQSSEPKRIMQWLWKNYTYYKKSDAILLPDIKEPTTPRGSTLLAKEMIYAEVEFYKAGLTFSSAPVFYRGR